MRAFVIRRYGGPDVARLEDVPAPTVGPRDVLIDVAAAALNPIDFKLREGKVKLVTPMRFPIILGCDVAGEVAAIGAEVTKLAVGDPVFARLEKGRIGGLAEQVAADEGVVARRPTTISVGEAAAIPLAGLTALQALRDVARVQPGQRVLIHAGAGGVGSLAIQIGKLLGAHVLATASTRNLGLLRELGADEPVDYSTGADRAVRDVDVVLDTLGGASELRSLAMVRPGGVVVGVSGLPDGPFAKAHLPAWTRPAIWLATIGRRRAARKAKASFRYLFMSPDGAELAELAAWLEAGTLRPLVHQTYPFADVASAFGELERGRARGKIVVEIRAAKAAGG